MDDLEHRLRSHLHSVDSAAVPSTDAVLCAADHSAAHAVRRRRAVAGGLATALVLAGAGGAWWATARDDEAQVVDTATPVTPTPSTATTGTAPDATTVTPTTAPAEPSTTQAPATTIPAEVEQVSSWTFLPADPRGATSRPAVVWTGTEAIEFGGLDPEGRHRAASAAVDPATGTWRTLSAAPAGFLADDQHIATWTGTRALVIGPSGAFAYDPADDAWSELAAAPFPASAELPWAWDGGRLWVWGDVPAVYDSARDEWTNLPEPPIEHRTRAASVWTGSEWLVWGGVDESWTDLADGAAYDPATNTWRVLAPSPLSARRVNGAWIGGEVIVFGGSSGGQVGTGNGELAHADGAAYDPDADAWRRIADGPAHPGHEPIFVPGPGRAGGHLVVFAKGFAMIYDPASDSWRDPCCDGDGLAGATPVLTSVGIILLGSFEPGIGGAIFVPR